MFLPRYSMAGFLGAVALLCVGLGAIESDSAWAASAAFTVALATLCFSVIGSFRAGAATRDFWLGYCVFGWVYFFSAFGLTLLNQPLRQRRYELITTKLIDFYVSIRTPRILGAKVMAQWQGGGYYSSTVVEVKNGTYRVKWDDGSPDSWVTLAQIVFHGENVYETGHSLFVPLVGLLGGLASSAAFGQERGKGEGIRGKG